MLAVGVEVLIDLFRHIPADPGDLLEIGQTGARDRPHRPEMMQQRLAPRGADAADVVELGAAERLLAPGTMAADGEAVRFVTQALQKIQHRVARLEGDRLAPRQEKAFAAGIAIRSLGDTDG